MAICTKCGKEYTANYNAKVFICAECRGFSQVEYKKKCVVCGKEFIAKRITQKCCSDACKRSRRKAAHVEKSLKQCALLSCKKDFYGNGRQKYCSPECARAAHNSNYHNVED